MSDKISKGGVVSGPIRMQKALAAGEGLAEASACATKCKPSGPSGKNTK